MCSAASTTTPMLKDSQDVQESGPWYDTPGYLQGGYVGTGEFCRIEVQLHQAGVLCAIIVITGLICETRIFSITSMVMVLTFKYVSERECGLHRFVG